MKPSYATVHKRSKENGSSSPAALILSSNIPFEPSPLFSKVFPVGRIRRGAMSASLVLVSTTHPEHAKTRLAVTASLVVWKPFAVTSS